MAVEVGSLFQNLILKFVTKESFVFLFRKTQNFICFKEAFQSENIVIWCYLYWYEMKIIVENFFIERN